ncbi:hypothetical protein [Tsuneonella sp. HG222]
MTGFATWLDGTSKSLALKNALWVVPTVQTVHILAMCLVLTAGLFVGVRAWRVAGLDWPLSRWVERLYPEQWWALAVLLASGLVLIAAEPVRELPNYVFQLKMLGVVLATSDCLWLQRRIAVRNDGEAGIADKLIALALFALWLAIIFAGRWIAYV